MIEALKRTLTFQGRLTRLGYWRWQLGLALVAAAVAYGAVAVTMGGAPRWVAALFLAPGLVAVVAALGVVVRRLHDRNRGAVWLLVFSVVPWALGGVSIWIDRNPAGDLDGLASAALAASLASLVLNVWGFVEIGLLRGSPAENRFGAAPR